MSWILLTKYSIFAYVQLLLSILITGYLWSVKKPSRPTRLLQYLFSTFSLVMAGGFLFLSNFTANSLYLVLPIAFLWAIALLQLMRFGYAFPQDDFPSESDWAFRLLIPLLFIMPATPYLLWQKVIGTGLGLIILSSAIVLPFAWLIIVFFRKVRRYRQQGLKNHRSRIRAFTSLLVLPFGVGTLISLEIVNILSLSWALVLMQVLVMLFLLLFVAIYTNNAPEPTTFLVKIIGPALICIMVIMGEMGTMHLISMEELITERRLNEIERIRDIVEDDEVTAFPPLVLSISRLGPNSTSEVIYARQPEEFPGFQEAVVAPQIEAELLKAFRANPGLNLDVMKTKLFSGLQRTEVITIQRDYHLAGLSFDNLRQTYYYFSVGNSLYRVVFPYRDFPATIHRSAVRLLLYITAVTLFLLLVLPLFYRSNLIRPISRLMDGLRAVDGGDLSIKVPVKSGDEIGFLTQNFNEMVASIRQTREALKTSNRTLEQKIEARTRDLQLKNHDLEAAMDQLHQTQEQLLLQKKMASIGNLVAGLAHEINNPVGAIRSAADVSRRCLEKIKLNGSNGGSEKYLKILTDNNRVTEEAGLRISDLVENLRNFSRLDEASFQKADIHQCLESTLKLLVHNLPAGVSIEKNFAELPSIHCQPARLNQAFMHVLENAIDAVGKEGRIRISTFSDKKRVRIEIEDNGRGIPGELLKNLFEFHLVSGGNRVRLGSGLSTTYQVLQEHRGEIHIDSVEGNGTIVSISLPRE